jgi:hypothetical protein
MVRRLRVTPLSFRGPRKMATTRTNLLTTHRRRARNHLPRSSRGVFRRRSIGGARCGVLRLRLVTAGLLGRPGAPPAGHYDPAARSSLHGLRRIMPQTEARPPAKNRHGGAPRGERPTLLDARRLASAWPAASRAGPTDAQRSIRAPVGAPPTPRRWVQVHKPGRLAPRERVVLCEWAV